MSVITERWGAIELWLSNNHPRSLEHWNPPATLTAIAAAEAALGVELPSDYKELLAIHNGQAPGAAMIVGSLFRVEDLPGASAGVEGDGDEVPAELVGKGIRQIDWSKGWLPIAKSANAEDLLCIDLDPAVDGTRGQIIQVRVEESARRLIAKDFGDLLSLYLEQMQAGDIDLARD